MNKGWRGWQIAVAFALICILSIGIYESNKASRSRREIEEKATREFIAQMERRREEDELRQKIARAKAAFSEMPLEKKHIKCMNHPNLCLVMGMREHDVVEMMGWPDKKNKSTFSVLGVTHYHQQWVYEIWHYQATYVYFEDGLVTGWQSP